MISRAFILWLALASTACGPQSKSGDQLVDMVAMRVDPHGNCLTIVGQTNVYLRNLENPPFLQLYPTAFKNRGARAAAEKLARPWQSKPSEPLQVKKIGHFEGDRCLTEIQSPAYSGEYGFVAFSSASGFVGAYAFKRSLTGWSEVELVRRGYW